eukprot:870066-Rhodomonas_salina.3
MPTKRYYSALTIVLAVTAHERSTQSSYGPSSTVLRICYATSELCRDTSGTDAGNAATRVRDGERFGPGRALFHPMPYDLWGEARYRLRVCRALPGTDALYGAVPGVPDPTRHL